MRAITVPSLYFTLVVHHVTMGQKALASKQTTCVLFAITSTESKLSKLTLEHKRK